MSKHVAGIHGVPYVRIQSTDFYTAIGCDEAKTTQQTELCADMNKKANEHDKCAERLCKRGATISDQQNQKRTPCCKYPISDAQGNIRSRSAQDEQHYDHAFDKFDEALDLIG